MEASSTTTSDLLESVDVLVGLETDASVSVDTNQIEKDAETLKQIAELEEAQRVALAAAEKAAHKLSLDTAYNILLKATTEFIEKELAIQRAADEEVAEAVADEAA